MSGGVAGGDPPARPAALLSRADSLLAAVNRILMAGSMVALLAACVILTSSVLSRYFLRAATDWQDEASVFLLVSATFLCSAGVQSQRGHIGIDAIAGLLPGRANRIRQRLCDLASLGFCTFFAWKSWTLWLEAWVDNETTESSWGPPLWIPYGAMAFGMSLLSVQLLLQLLRAGRDERGRGHGAASGAPGS
ncbi:MAG TPA: TRAP transporter small permease [Burkholderiaceae bacterium]